MKILKNRHGLLWLFTALFAITSIASLIFAPQYILYSGYAGWAFVAAYFWQFFQTRNTESKGSLAKAFIVISLFQLSLLAIFYGFCKLTTVWLINYSSPQLNSFNQSLRLLWWDFGLFPWPAIALFTVLIKKNLVKSDTFPHSILPSHYHATAENALGLLTNTATRGAIILLLSLTISFSALGLLYLAAPNATHQLLGFQPIILILLLGLFAFLASKNTESLWRQLHGHVLFSPFIVLPSLILLLSLILFIFLAAAISFSETLKPSVHVIEWLAHAGWNHYWQICALSFWLICIMPTSLWLSTATKDLCNQKTLVLILCWPIIFSLILGLFSGLNWHFPQNPTIDVLILLAGSLGLASLLANQTRWQIASRGYIEKNLTKHRPATRLMRNISMITLLITYLFWQGSVMALSFLLLLVALPLMLLFLLVCLA